MVTLLIIAFAVLFFHFALVGMVRDFFVDVMGWPWRPWAAWLFFVPPVGLVAAVVIFVLCLVFVAGGCLARMFRRFFKGYFDYK